MASHFNPNSMYVMTTDSSKLKQKTGLSFEKQPFLETSMSPPVGRHERDQITSVIYEEKNEIESNLIPDYLPRSKSRTTMHDVNDDELAEFEQIEQSLI
jgi:hypothetical protein